MSCCDADTGGLHTKLGCHHEGRASVVGYSFSHVRIGIDPHATDPFLAVDEDHHLVACGYRLATPSAH